MAHISSIGAAMFTDLSVITGTVTSGKAEVSPTQPATKDAAGFQALFSTNVATPFAAKYAKISNVREFPAIGAPANIVSVPVYGQKQGQSIGGQSDAPSLEVTINFVASDWAKAAAGTTPESSLANMVGDGISRVWRFTLMNADTTGSTVSGASQSKYDSNAGGLGTTQNSQYYFFGKLESLLVTPSLTDATTATIAISVQSDFYGAYTI
jgi:hypothetical protein